MDSLKITRACISFENLHVPLGVEVSRSEDTAVAQTAASCGWQGSTALWILHQEGSGWERTQQITSEKLPLTLCLRFVSKAVLNFLRPGHELSIGTYFPQRSPVSARAQALSEPKHSHEVEKPLFFPPLPSG